CSRLAERVGYGAAGQDRATIRQDFSWRLVPGLERGSTSPVMVSSCPGAMSLSSWGVTNQHSISQRALPGGSRWSMGGPLPVTTLATLPRTVRKLLPYFWLALTGSAWYSFQTSSAVRLPATGTESRPDDAPPRE